MPFTHLFQLVAAFVALSTIVLGVGAHVARSNLRRRVDLGVVSQRWLMAHRAED